MKHALPWLRFGAALCLAAPLSAQNFNIDIGSGNAAPSTALAAAAGQSGTWNQITSTISTPLVDTAGAATGVTISQQSGTGVLTFFFNNAATSGDDELLMDDAQDVGGTGGSCTWQVSGLAAGTYEVYTYAWAPDSALYITTVNAGGGTTAVGGAWPNGYVAGITHAFDTVTIPTGGVLTLILATQTSFSTFNGLQIKSLGTPTTSYCFGDGTGTLCPCSNVGVNGHGCANSVNPSGALLTATGVASATIANDSFQLNAAGVPNGPGLYFQGTTQLNGGLGVLFGDGLRCTGGTIIRLGIVQAAGNASTYPTGVTPPNNIRISQKGLITAGDVRNYQLWYRDSGVFCTASVFNLTNAINVTWQP